jgi:hypothetical protein
LKRLLALLATAGALAIVPIASAHVAAVRHGHVVVDGKPFFPIMQWLQCPWLFEPNAQLGINTFFGKGCQSTTDAQELAGTAAVNAWSVLPAGGPGSGANLLGWHFSDEPDMNRILPAAVARQYRANRRRDPTKLNFLTVTSGFSARRGPPAWMHGSTAPYSAYAKATDLIGTDVYPIYGWCHPDWISWVADAQRELVKLAAGRPTYQWIEAASTSSQWCKGRGVEPEELRAEVWMAIANGAKAIGYFTHSWTPSYSQFRVAPDVQAEMKRTDAEITALAPAILAPAAPLQLRVAEARVDAIARHYGGKTYVFAVNVSRTGAGVTFTSPAFHGSASVYGESRSLPVSGGSFADGFGPLAVHVYVIG